MKLSRIITAAGILIFWSVWCVAAEPEKVICPAPASQSERNAAVNAACGYFNSTMESWGLHSAFDRNGSIITCLHFSCQNSPELVTAKVKCVFRNSFSMQKCWSVKGSCEGKSTCIVDVTGREGEKVVWRSSCGVDSVSTTISKGRNEYAIFSSCPSPPIILPLPRPEPPVFE